MRAFFFTFLLIVSLLSGNAQITMNLKTLEFTRNLQNTIPLRDIVEEEDGVTVTYIFNHVNILNDPLYKNARIVKIDGFWPNTSVGTPAFLLRWDTFIVPNRNAKIIVVDSTFIDYPMELSPARPVLSNSSNGTFSKDNVKPIAHYNGLYPCNVIPATRKDEYRGINLLDVCVNPVQYDFNNKKVRFFTKIRYKIKYDASILAEEMSKTNKFVCFENNSFLKNIALNSFMCDRVKNNRPTGPYFNSKYLIVTVPKYENAVNQFAEWKRTLGFDVQIAMQESWDTIAVRNVVRNAYMTNGLEYLLIFGGQNDVPAPIRDEIYNGEHHRHPTDLYYGCFGEGYTPDIFRGRLLVKTSEEAMTVVNKIINYEKNPVDDVNYYKRGIHCAQFEDERHFDYSTMSWIPVNGYEDQRFVLTSERIRNRMLSVIDSVNRVYYADSNVTPTNWNTPDYANGDSIPAELRDSLFKWDGDSADIIRLMNQKAFYVLMRGHGFSDKWYRPLFNRSSISHLSNGNYLPVVFSIACLTGKYNSSIDCFCERFLKKENGGCVAIYGASCESLSGPNDVLAEGMFDAIWPSSSLLPQFGMINGTSYSPTPIPDYHLGQILDQGLKRCNEAYLNTTNDWYPRYTYEVYHCFGDPSMMIHTLKPQPFTNASITRINDSIYVNTGGLLSNITFFNKRTGEVNSIMGFSHTYPNDPDISVCISAHNMIPYIDDGTLYLQNKTFTSSNNYKAQKIKVGNHVISNFPHGDVNFTQGNYTLMGEEVELQSGTTISAGVSLEIKNP